MFVNKMMLGAVVIVSTGLTVLTACQPQATNSSTVPSTASSAAASLSFKPLDAAQAHTMFSNKKAIMVDVREDNEWAEGHIDGALHIPLGQLSTRLNELAAYKDSPIIMQCRSGRRSAKAAQLLIDNGFTQVYNLEGGISAWQGSGFNVTH